MSLYKYSAKQVRRVATRVGKATRTKEAMLLAYASIFFRAPMISSSVGTVVTSGSPKKKLS